ncbi:MAG: hypothetical protein U1E73_01130 [Planctomycetota bacterium]
MNSRSGGVFAVLLTLAFAGLSTLAFLGSAAPDVAPTKGGAQLERTAVGTSVHQGNGDEELALRTAVVDDAPCLRVLDAADLGPLRDCRIEVRWADGRQRTAVTAADGMCRVPGLDSGEVEIAISCAGFCALRGRWRCAAEVTTFAVERAGAVRVTARDAAGKPAAGVALALLPPPLVPGDWAHVWSGMRSRDAGIVASAGVAPLEEVDGIVRTGREPFDLGDGCSASGRFVSQSPWQRRTDENGVATWTGIAPAIGYRLGGLRGNHLDLEPPFEVARLTETPQGVQLRPGGPADLSGRFDVAAGDDLRFAATCVGEAAVFGRIVCAGGSAPLVKLCRIHQAGGDGIERVTTMDPELVQTAGDDGAFRFEGVRPGILALRVCWLEAGRDIRFVSVTFQLLPGAELDLGDLAARVGGAFAVRTTLRAADGACRPELVFADGENTPAVLTICLMPDNQLAADCVIEHALVPYGREFVVHGLPPGRLQLAAQPVAGAATLPDIVGVDCSQVFERRLEEVGTLVDLAVPVVAGVTRAIRFLDPFGNEVPIDCLQTRDLASGRIEATAVRMTDLLPVVGSVITLPRGRYEGLALVRRGNDTLCGHCEFDMADAPGEAVTVRLSSGGAVRGVALDAAGRPAAGRTLRWSPGPWAAAGIWLFAAVPGADGSFEVAGLPPGMALTGSGVGELPAVGSGQCVGGLKVLLD